MRRVVTAIKDGIILGAIYCTIVDNVGDIAFVSGASMRPTLNPKGNSNDVILLDRLSLVVRKEFQRGEVVALWAPDEVNKSLVKRIIYLEGDVIPSKVFAFNTWMNRTQDPNHLDPVVRVPKGFCWVEGDNLAQSRDSNYFGFVPLALIHGRAKAIIWPPSRIQFIKSEIPRR